MAKMEIDTLTVSNRSETGKGPNRRLRASGQVPAVIYGTGEEAIMVALNYRELEKALSKPNAETNLFNLAGDVVGGKDTVVLREIQRDPVTRRFLHLDLLRVSMSEEAEFDVPVHTSGTPVGVREGGVMETHLRSISVRCLPTKLPEEIIVDIAGLGINQSFHVRDIQLPEGLSLVTEGAETLFAVHAPRTITEGEEGAAGAAAAQPEVIGKPAEEK